jgi:hypothetical protein
MDPYMRDEREIDATASRAFTRAYLIAFVTAAAIGLGIGVVWVVAGLLHVHPLW